jgi:CRP/FNR family cyclic AMP-dependent transcriptional regulator
MKVVVAGNDIIPNRKRKKMRAFDAQVFLDSAGVARTTAQYRRSQKIFSQGDPATSVIYI